MWLGGLGASKNEGLDAKTGKMLVEVSTNAISGRPRSISCMGDPTKAHTKCWAGPTTTKWQQLCEEMVEQPT